MACHAAMLFYRQPAVEKRIDDRRRGLRVFPMLWPAPARGPSRPIANRFSKWCSAAELKRDLNGHDAERQWHLHRLRFRLRLLGIEHRLAVQHDFERPVMDRRKSIIARMQDLNRSVPPHMPAERRQPRIGRFAPKVVEQECGDTLIPVESGLAAVKLTAVYVAICNNK